MAIDYSKILLLQLQELIEVAEKQQASFIEQEKQIEFLKAQLAKKEEVISARNNVIKEKNLQNLKYQKEIVQQYKKISKLTSYIEELQEILQNGEADIEENAGTSGYYSGSGSSLATITEENEEEIEQDLQETITEVDKIGQVEKQVTDSHEGSMYADSSDNGIDFDDDDDSVVEDLHDAIAKNYKIFGSAGFPKNSFHPVLSTSMEEVEEEKCEAENSQMVNQKISDTISDAKNNNILKKTDKKCQNINKINRHAKRRYSIMFQMAVY